MLRDRRSVMLITYDLPVTDKRERSEYRKFHKYLNTAGYIMIQQSVYIKLLHFEANAEAEIKDIHLNAPLDGNILVLQMSIAQFKKTKQLRGERLNISWFSDNFLCV